MTDETGGDRIGSAARSRQAGARRRRLERPSCSMLIPADTTGVAVVRLGELRSAPALPPVRGALPLPQRRRRLRRFHPRHRRRPGQGRRGVAGRLPRQIGKCGHPACSSRPRALRRGRPRGQAQLAGVTSARGKDGVTLYRFAHGKEALSFPVRGIGAFGDEASVLARPWPCCAAAPRTPGRLGDFAPRLQGLGRNGQFWGALTVDHVLRRTLDSVESQAGAAAGALGAQVAVVRRRLQQRPALHASGVAASGDEADLVRQSLEGSLAFAKLGTKRRPRPALGARRGLRRAPRRASADDEQHRGVSCSGSCPPRALPRSRSDSRAR